MLQPVTQIRYSGMDAGIQSQGYEILSGIAPEQGTTASIYYHPRQ